MCNYSIVKLHEAAKMFRIVDYVREMTAKKVGLANVDCLSICSSSSKHIIIAYRNSVTMVKFFDLENDLDGLVVRGLPLVWEAEVQLLAESYQ